MKLWKRYLLAFLLCVYFAAVLCLCLFRPENLPEMNQVFLGIPIDKVAHFLMFLPYPVLAYLTFRPEDGRRRIRLIVLLSVFAMGIALAMGTEKLQGLSEYRSFEIEDFYADVLGMECSAFIMALLIIFRKRP
jgi:VanZ family protein